MRKLMLCIAVLSLLTFPTSAQVIGPLEGQHAPDFNLELLDGNQFTLSEEDAPVVMYFWATWCSACAQTAQAINDFSQSQSEIFVLGVNMNERHTLVADYINKHEYRFVTGIDRGELAARYLIRFLPTVILVDSQGVVLKRHIGLITTEQLTDWYAQVVPDNE